MCIRHSACLLSQSQSHMPVFTHYVYTYGLIVCSRHADKPAGHGQHQDHEHSFYRIHESVSSVQVRSQQPSIWCDWVGLGVDCQLLAPADTARLIRIMFPRCPRTRCCTHTSRDCIVNPLGDVFLISVPGAFLHSPAATSSLEATSTNSYFSA